MGAQDIAGFALGTYQVSFVTKDWDFWELLVPQILRFSLPGLGNVWQLSLKDSTLISVTGLAELM